MLDFQLQQAPLRFGLAEGVEPHQTPFGTLMSAINARWIRSGELSKRFGVSLLTNGVDSGASGTITSGSRLVVRGDELALIDGTKIYSYDGSTWRRPNKYGDIPSVGLTWKALQSGQAGMQSSDVGYTSDGKVIHAWITGDPGLDLVSRGFPQYRVFKRGEESTTVPVTVIGGAGTADSTHVRVVTSGTDWAIVYDTTGAVACVVNGNPAVQLRTDAKIASPVAFDACTIGSLFAIAYHKNANGIGLYTYSFAATPVQQASGAVTGDASTSIQCISIDATAGELLWIGWHTTTAAAGYKIATANPTTLVQALAPTVVRAGTTFTHPTLAILSRPGTSSCLYARSNCDSSGGSEVVGFTETIKVTSAGAITVGSQRLGYGVRLLSRPFYMGSDEHVFVGNYMNSSTIKLSGYPPQSGTFLVGCAPAPSSGTTELRLVGHVEAITGGTWTDLGVPNVSVVSSTESLLCTPTTINAPAGADVGWSQGAKLVSVTRTTSLPADMWRNVTLGAEQCLSAGVLTAYDGQMCFDYGFPFAPVIDKYSTIRSTTGGQLANGNYIYSAVPEFSSAAGVLHRGPPAVPTTLAVGGAGLGSVDLYVVPVHPTSKFDGTGQSPGAAAPLPIRLGLYRSVVGGTIPQRRSVDPSFFVLNQSQLNSTQHILDTAYDSSLSSLGALVPLASRPALYTVGGELEDYAPPSSITLTEHQSRIWSLAGDRRTWWFSKDGSVSPGTAPGFHPSMTFSFNEEQVAAMSMDDKLIVYGEDSINMIVGQGPAPNGSGSTYEVIPVQTDVGCSNPRSIVSVPAGHMFQTARGIYLLSRQLELSWIGRPVKSQLAAYPNITSAVVVAKHNEVRFTAMNAAGDASIVLVFNYVENQWTTSSYPGVIADSCVYQGVWTYLTTGGRVYQESSSTYLDDGVYVQMTIETAWNNAGGPLAFQSVRNFSIEGVSNTNHDLTISVGFDDETSYSQTRTFAAGSSVTSIGPLESCVISIGTRRKCQSIRFKIQDATPTNPGTYPVGTGQGPSFSMLGIEVGIKKGFTPRGALRTG